MLDLNVILAKEIIAFRRREEQQKLKQGFSNLIITSSSRLRGGQGPSDKYIRHG